MPFDSDVGFWKWLSGGIGGAVTGGFGYHKYMEGKISKKADKEDVANCLRHIESLYANAEKDRAFTRDLFDRAVERIQENQTEIIKVVSQGRER